MDMNSEIRTENLLPVRILTAEDLPCLMDFFDRMSPETRDFFNPGDVNRIRAAKHFADPSDDAEIYFGAFDSAGSNAPVLAGFAFLWDLPTFIPWLGICVREEWKGRHLGRTLLKALDIYALAHGCGGLLLTTRIENKRAQALYSRMGYEWLGTHRNGEYLYLKRYERKQTVFDENEIKSK